MTSHDAKIDVKIALIIFGLAVAGIGSVYNLKAQAQVQDNKIQTNQAKIAELNIDIRDLAKEVVIVNKKLDALLVNRGINPRTVENATISATTALNEE